MNANDSGIIFRKNIGTKFLSVVDESKKINQTNGTAILKIVEIFSKNQFGSPNDGLISYVFSGRVGSRNDSFRIFRQLKLHC